MDKLRKLGVLPFLSEKVEMKRSAKHGFRLPNSVRSVALVPLTACSDGKEELGGDLADRCSITWWIMKCVVMFHRFSINVP